MVKLHGCAFVSRCEIPALRGKGETCMVYGEGKEDGYAESIKVGGKACLRFRGRASFLDGGVCRDEFRRRGRNDASFGAYILAG